MKKFGKLFGLCVAGSALLTACGGPASEQPATENVAETPIVAETPAPDSEPAIENAAEVNSADAAANEMAPTPTPTPTPTATPAAEKAATPTPTPTPVAAAAVERPAQFAMCAACHTVDEGGPNRVGPNLFGVAGSKAGSKAGYAYSEAMKGSGITWTPAELEAFLLAPQAKVPGTKMMVKGPADEKARKAIVDYLGSLK